MITALGKLILKFRPLILSQGLIMASFILIILMLLVIIPLPITISTYIKYCSLKSFLSNITLVYLVALLGGGPLCFAVWWSTRHRYDSKPTKYPQVLDHPTHMSRLVHWIALINKVVMLTYVSMVFIGKTHLYILPRPRSMR